MGGGKLSTMCAQGMVSFVTSLNPPPPPPSQPQQLSTYALTLFKHKTQVGDQEVHVGESGTLVSGGPRR